MNTISVSQRLNELMSIKDVSQADIAKAAGLNRATISCYVSGKRIPANYNIFIIANAYNINPSWLMGFDVPMDVEHKFETEEERVYSDVLNNNPELKEYILNYNSFSKLAHSIVTSSIKYIMDVEKD